MQVKLSNHLQSFDAVYAYVPVLGCVCKLLLSLSYAPFKPSFYNNATNTLLVFAESSMFLNFHMENLFTFSFVQLIPLELKNR